MLQNCLNISDTSTPVGVTKTKREISKTTVMESLVMVQKEEHLRLEKQHMDLIQGTEVTTLNQGQSSTEDLDVIQFWEINNVSLVD